MLNMSIVILAYAVHVHVWLMTRLLGFTTPIGAGSCDIGSLSRAAAKALRQFVLESVGCLEPFVCVYS